jgi:hypothetical protein
VTSCLLCLANLVKMDEMSPNPQTGILTLQGHLNALGRIISQTAVSPSYGSDL